jgi:regulator of RNase E activity RraA
MLCSSLAASAGSRGAYVYADTDGVVVAREDLSAKKRLTAAIKLYYDDEKGCLFHDSVHMAKNEQGA